MKLPKKCIVDTNVPINANLAEDPDQIPDDLIKCVKMCVEAIAHMVNKGTLIIDSNGEIFKEYLNNLSLSKRNGIGNLFMKWVHDNLGNESLCEIIKISIEGDSYIEFPNHPGLENFDKSDQKFVAVANAHPEKPVILQSTDSKWWGWQKALAEVGIDVTFLCPEYVEEKYRKKIEE